MSFFKRFFNKEKKEDLDQGLEKTKTSLFGQLGKAVAGKSRVDEELLDEIESILIASDVGLETTIKIINRLEKRVAEDKYLGTSDLNSLLHDEVVRLMSDANTANYDSYELPTDGRPAVILVVGVNGVGKTTTIGKLAHQFQKQGHKVLLGAADTFRAAAVDQLGIWADRTGVDFFSKGMNVDPAAVAFEATDKAVKEGYDVVIIDTAGRLHNKVGLMNELSKIHRSIAKNMEGAPHEVILVLDASTGQNAYEQAKHFTEATNVTAIALTKLDGTAKGGVVIGISDQFQTPIKYIGVGEGVEQLQIFNKQAFVESLFGGQLVGDS
ncbi:MAG: signal recognition particle-docking protein FtsY [Saprospiraceae bacterium]